MTDWFDQYSAALDLRDVREQAHKPYIDAYARLADRMAAAATQPLPSANPTTSSPAPPSRSTTPRSKPKDDSPALEQNPQDLISALRHDLSTTQKARALLETRVSDLTHSLSQLQLQSRQSTSEITLLTKQKLETERKLRDVQEEIRGKGDLVERAQDEMVALSLQLNMAEQRSEKLVRENKELVERWMKRMGEEVERVNRDSKWE
ncbi:related to Autophagy protein 16 [Ramularia collo-cygni]|uniref:Related to Autophagy protein 16 n=1 Tax=Ramularia collo-cygni TaxID=112498 RepID=A0A2D3V990_9PEZI|nr:related to Autophagy protein 16 [Ramularia collo-cygni]CZT23490.1 related to Autophagy protein 16 [Ramularia collo-cygni]